MGGQPANLRPYGDSWSNNAPAVEGGTMEEQALNRARHKLEAVRSGRSGDRPAGTDLRLLIPGALLALLFGAPLLVGAISVFSSGKAAGFGIFLLVLGLLILCIPLLVYMQTRPV